MSADARLAAWLGFLGDVLGEQFHEMPHQLILEQLRATFACTGASFSWIDARGDHRLIAAPMEALRPVIDQVNDWNESGSRWEHPLLKWHRITRDARAMTLGRVPGALTSRESRADLEKALRPFELDQQLTINYPARGSAFRTIFLGRGGRDFTDEDLFVARHVQRALIGFDRHVLWTNRDRACGEIAVDRGLTERESTVLGLISAGHSSRVVSRRLGCSPRTVEKHLERIYRKLGVQDRLNAVRVARVAWRRDVRG